MEKTTDTNIICFVYSRQEQQAIQLKTLNFADLTEKEKTHTYRNENWQEVKEQGKHLLIATSGAVLEYKGKYKDPKSKKDYNEALPVKLKLKYKPDGNVAEFYASVGDDENIKHHILMAKAFLNKLDNDGLTVHHIDNNVLNLSVYNLMLLDWNTHRKI